MSIERLLTMPVECRLYRTSEKSDLGSLTPLKGERPL